MRLQHDWCRSRLATLTTTVGLVTTSIFASPLSSLFFWGGSGVGFAYAGSSDGLYPRASAVIQVSGERQFRKAVFESEYASIVEFYAPWCGHCQNLKETYGDLAKKGSGLVNVVAVDCEDERNKREVCGPAQIQGFPTLKLHAPPPPNKKGKSKSSDDTDEKSKSAKKPTKPKFGSVPFSTLVDRLDDYNSKRTVGAMLSTVAGLTPNHVTVLSSSDKLQNWLTADSTSDLTKIVLATTKTPGTVKPLFRALAIKFLDRPVQFGQVSKSAAANVPVLGGDGAASRLVVFGPKLDPDGVVYSGPMELGPIGKFLDKHLPSKPTKSATSSRSSTSSSSSSSSSPASQSSPPTSFLESCLGPKSAPCIVLLLPPSDAPPASNSDKAPPSIPSSPYLSALHHLSQKHSKPSAGKARLPALFALLDEKIEHTFLRRALHLDRIPFSSQDDQSNKPSSPSRMIMIYSRRGFAPFTPVNPSSPHEPANPSTLPVQTLIDQVSSWVDDFQLGSLSFSPFPQNFMAAIDELRVEPGKPMPPDLARREHLDKAFAVLGQPPKAQDDASQKPLRDEL